MKAKGLYEIAKSEMRTAGRAPCGLEDRILNELNPLINDEITQDNKRNAISLIKRIPTCQKHGSY